jgi:hypothetical protein
MSVFNQSYAGETIGLKTPERCKPDYESIIGRLTAGSKVSKDLLDAVESYIQVRGSGNDAFTLTGLIGQLYLDIKSFDKGIAEAITEQEKDK